MKFIVTVLMFSNLAWSDDVFTYPLGTEPDIIHPIMSIDGATVQLNEYVQATLCYTDLETAKNKPYMAESWSISENGLEYIVNLKKNVTFHDGSNFTAEDVKFSLEAIRDPRHQAFSWIPYFDIFSRIEIIDKYKVKFVASVKYFETLDSICNMPILAKATYGDIDKSIKLGKVSIGAGPYKIVKYNRGDSIILKKVDNWFGDNDPDLKKFNLFKNVKLMFVRDSNITLERLKKGDIDYAKLNAESYLNLTGHPFKNLYKGKNFKALAVKTKSLKLMTYIGFNLKDSMLQDKNVRLGLSHLYNREEINKKFYDNTKLLATSPIVVTSPQAADVKPILFDLKKAQEYFLKAGYSDTDKNGILDKVVNGKKQELILSLIYHSEEDEKQLTLFKEDCKKAGVVIELKKLEIVTFQSYVRDGKAQLWDGGWNASGTEMDAKQIWHSTSISKGGSNLGYYINPEVDKYIDLARSELDLNKRNKLFKKVYTLIAEDVPYIFLFDTQYEYYAVSDRVKRKVDTYPFGYNVRTWSF